MNRPRSTLGRIEKLEQTYGVGVSQLEPTVIRVQYVTPDGEVTGGYMVGGGKLNAPVQTTSESRRA
jgi:hypothetical protein